MLQIFRKNFGLKLISVALAILGWAYFRFATNPVIAARFNQQLSVPIVAVHVPDGFIVRYPEKQAVVTIASNRGTAPAVKPDDVKAVVDAGNHSPGVYNVPVELVAPNVVVQSLSPASETITVERIEQKTFPLELHYTGEHANIVAASTRVSPAGAVLRAASSDLEHVTGVRVDVGIPNAPGKFDAMVRPVAIDASGVEVQGVQVAPNLVRVQVDFVGASH
ncbi:MAG: hypothetical protein JOZ38_11705 [Candidatus Eremiobacteraeota bacterium]|nr:hypothetical protein [Candidatus Eremiobacteraeota bacterium]